MVKANSDFKDINEWMHFMAQCHGGFPKADEPLQDANRELEQLLRLPHLSVLRGEAPPTDGTSMAGTAAGTAATPQESTRARVATAAQKLQPQPSAVRAKGDEYPSLLAHGEKRGQQHANKPRQQHHTEYYTVVGGRRGGIVVRAGKHLQSDAYPMLLATGAIVRQVQCVGDRMMYEKVHGFGPSAGWVTTRIQDRPLVEPFTGTLPA